MDLTKKNWYFKKLALTRKQMVSFLISIFPIRVQEIFYRKAVKVPSSLPEDIVIKIAETREELESAFSLLYKVYCDYDYIDRNKAGLFLKKYHALPGSSVIIALHESKVIGTVSVFKDSEMGLPLDEVFDASVLRQKGVIAEVSSFAIDEEYRRFNKGKLLFYMMKYLWEYASKYQKVEYLVISIYPRHRAFYSSILLFKSLSKKVANYMGKPACCAYLNLKNSPKRYESSFSKLPEISNFYKFFVKNKTENFIFPQKSFSQKNLPAMDYHRFKYFFKNKTSLYFNLTKEDCRIFAKLYKITSSPNQYDYSIIKHLNLNVLEQRYKVDVQGSIMFEDGTISPFFCRNVSRSGICIRPKGFHDLKPNTKLNLKILLKDTCITNLVVTTKWYDDDKIGCRILDKDVLWDNYIDILALHG